MKIDRVITDRIKLSGNLISNFSTMQFIGSTIGETYYYYFLQTQSKEQALVLEEARCEKIAMQKLENIIIIVGGSKKYQQKRRLDKQQKILIIANYCKILENRQENKVYYRKHSANKGSF